MHNLDLSISDISKIEGKASCEIKVRDGEIKDVRFAVAEYKRFYTAAIKGKDVASIPQYTARICGTCSNAHLLCALKAVENSQGVIPSEQTVKLRQLVNYGLIIRDHTLHLYVFVLPDLFNKDSLLDFDENNPLEHKYLHDTFDIKAAGNHLGICVGGRSVHAPFLAVGGFTRLPDMEALQKTSLELETVRPKVIDMVKLFSQKDFKQEVSNMEFAALMDKYYSFLEGSVIASGGLEISSLDYGKNLKHVAIPYSHASGYKFRDKVYMTGALARLNLAKDRLHPRTRKDIAPYLSHFPSKNIFHNNLAQAIEVLHSIDSSIDIINTLELKPETPVSFTRKSGEGIGVIEAPRGILFYKLEVNSDGKIKTGQIIVPTGQNQIFIEKCIRLYLEKNIKKIENKEKIEHEVEKIVRAFDPCMSCASHFLKFKYS